MLDRFLDRMYEASPLGQAALMTIATLVAMAAVGAFTGVIFLFCLLVAALPDVASGVVIAAGFITFVFLVNLGMAKIYEDD